MVFTSPAFIPIFSGGAWGGFSSSHKKRFQVCDVEKFATHQTISDSPHSPSPSGRVGVGLLLSYFSFLIVFTIIIFMFVLLIT